MYYSSDDACLVPNFYISFSLDMLIKEKEYIAFFIREQL